MLDSLLLKLRCNGGLLVNDTNANCRQEPDRRCQGKPLTETLTPALQVWPHQEKGRQNHFIKQKVLPGLTQQQQQQVPKKQK